MERPTRFRWIIIGLLFFICVNNYLDRSAIAYAITPIAAEYHLSPQKIGLILSAFGMGYAFTTLLGGILTDRFGGRLILFLSVLSWSILGGLVGFAGGFTSLFMLRFLLGIAEGPNFSTVSKVITDWLPINERVAALGWVIITVPLALAIGAPIISLLIVYVGWRAMFFVLSAMGLLWLPFWWYFFRNTPHDSVFVNEAEKNYIGVPKIDKQNTIPFKALLAFLLSSRTFLVNSFAYLVFGYFLFFFMTWLPTYFSLQYHLNIKQIGWFSVLPWLLAAIFMATTAYLSDYIYKHTQNLRYARTYPIMISQLLAAVSILPILYIHQVFLALFCISLATAFMMSTNPLFYAVNADIAQTKVGTVVGVMNMTFALAGFGSATLTGYIVQKTGNFDAAFMLLFLLGFSSAGFLFFWHNPQNCKKLLV